MKETERALKMLAMALAMEEKGKKFYDRAAAKSQNELGKKIFIMLALDEVVHMERIRKIWANLSAHESWPENWKRMGVRHQELGPVFRTLARKYGPAVTKKSGDLKALEMALQFESESINLYERELKKATDPKEKAFLSLMAAEERGHHAALADMRLYLQNPSAWFQEKERSGLDGA